MSRDRLEPGAGTRAAPGADPRDASVTPARQVAYEVVRRVFEEDAYADRAFRSLAGGLDERDRRFAQQLAYGTVRPVRKLDPPVRVALRLGAYQLVFAAGVAPHAAANESVELVRRARLERAVAFTNAVMRRLAEGARRLVDALPDGAPAEAALRHSYPDWIAHAWWEEWGRSDALGLMKAQNDAPETVVHVRADSPGEIGGDPVPGIPDARRVTSVDQTWLDRGLARPQSVGSQLAGLAAGVRPGERVLDLCAAPGGKTLQLAETAGEVVAVEMHPGRARELEETLKRYQTANVHVVVADGRELPRQLGTFDRVLVDAPCSGLGVLASRPDLRWRARPLPELQLELVRAGLERLAPGGTLTYAVCTVHRPENEAVVDALGVPIDDLGREWPAFRHPCRPEFLLTLPHVHRTSGFFVARLRP